jgi:DNA uptake protein ComE-like DNA-binding protein
MINRRFREYFTFTKKERNGIIVLLIILLLLILVKVYQSNKSFGEIVLINNDFQKDIKKFEESLIPKKVNEKDKRISSVDQVDTHKEVWIEPEMLFNFNPNKVPKKKLKDLGFTKKQINTLINFRNKGGQFYKKEDLLKIYGIEIEQYEILESYIIIDVQNDIQKKKEFIIEKSETKIIIEINSGAKEDLIKLHGIGNSFAERIIKYRDLLGGFYKKDQLLEVYGMDSTRYLGFIQDVLIDTNLINKLNLNKADFKTLIRHPYLNKYQTEAILKYKEVVGDFSKIEQIYQNNLLTIDEYSKLEPYLKLK